MTIIEKSTSGKLHSLAALQSGTSLYINMILTQDFEFSPDLILNLIKKFREETKHIDSDNLHSCKEGEKLELLSAEELFRRVSKSFAIKREDIELILGKTLGKKDIVAIAHFAIELANVSSKKRKLTDQQECDNKKSKDKKSVRYYTKRIVSCGLVVG